MGTTWSPGTSPALRVPLFPMGQYLSLQGEAGDLLPLGPYSWGGGVLAGPGHPPNSAYLLARGSFCPRQPARSRVGASTGEQHRAQMKGEKGRFEPPWDVGGAMLCLQSLCQS